MSQLRYYDIELNQPQGSWWQHLPKWDPKQGWFPSDQINDENAVYVARHSSGNPEDNLNNPEWRRLNLTIAGMAEMAQMAKHSGPTDPFSYLLGESEYMPRRGIDMKRSDTWMLPSAYAGQKSEKLADTIEHITGAQPNEFWETVVPTKDIDVNTSNIVYWTRLIHEPAMARETTPMGLPTMVEARANTDKTELGLFSIGARIGLGFWLTEIGTRFWFALLISIANGILVASQFAAAIAISTAEAKYAQQLRLNKTGAKPTMDYVFDDLAKTFACFQSPHHNFFQLLVTSLKEKARVRHAQAGEYALMTTPEAVIGLLKGNRDGFAYNISGPEGPARLKQEVMTKQNIYGIDVYVVPAFRMPNNYMCQAFAQPFEIGEYFTFMDEQVFAGEYDGHSRDRMIFTRDGWTEVTFEYAVEHLACWKPNGALRTPLHAVKPAVTKPSWWTGDLKTYAYYPFTNETMNAVQDGFPESRAEAVAMVNSKNPVPFSVIAIQLHQRGWGHYAYWMLPGKVAYRLRKPGHAVVEDSFTEHVHQVQVQYNAGCAVVYPQNLCEAKNVFVTNMETGYGIDEIIPENYHPDQPIGGVIGDMIFIPVPPCRQYKRVIGSDGSTVVWPGYGGPIYKRNNLVRNLNVRGIIEGDLEVVYSLDAELHANSYPGFRAMDAIFGWSARGDGAARRREFPDNYRSIDFPVNIVAREGCSRLFDPKTGAYTKFRSGSGYWKADGTYDGAQEHRNGGTFAQNPPRGKFIPV